MVLVQLVAKAESAASRQGGIHPRELEAALLNISPYSIDVYDTLRYLLDERKLEVGENLWLSVPKQTKLNIPNNNISIVSVSLQPEEVAVV